jgi:hypothetical protein
VKGFWNETRALFAIGIVFTLGMFYADYQISENARISDQNLSLAEWRASKVTGSPDVTAEIIPYGSVDYKVFFDVQLEQGITTSPSLSN